MNQFIGICLVVCLNWSSALGQEDLADRLIGTWKVSNSDTYETWESMGSEGLRGRSYRMQEGEVELLENLLLTFKNGKWTYTAQVLNQNEGRPVEFYQTDSEEGFCFQNKRHDFPQEICYVFEESGNLRITLSAEGQETVSMHLERLIKATERAAENENPQYDAGLAKQLGADDYGMKMYVLVILKTGPNDSASAEESRQLFRGHLDNIRRLVDEGKMIVAGPLGKNELSYRGIFIMDLSDVEEVRRIMQSDPAIAAGLLDVELISWYGSAALGEYLPASDKIWKKKP